MRSAALLAILLLLAGCAGAKPAGGPVGGATEGDPEKPAEFFDHEGAIRGRVTDDELLPVWNATVRLIGGERAAVTDEEGRFLFNHVPFGTYSLIASAEDHEPRGLGLTVDASREFEAHITMPRSPTFVDEKFSHMKPWTGYIACSVGLSGVTMPDECARYAALRPPTEGTSRFAMGRHANAVHYELFWSPSIAFSAKILRVHTQGSDQGLGVAPAGKNLSNGHWTDSCEKFGRNPIVNSCRFAQNATNPRWEQSLTNLTFGVLTHGGGTISDGLGNPSRWADNQSGPVFQQRFRLYATIFYGGLEIPEGFRNGPDS